MFAVKNLRIPKYNCQNKNFKIKKKTLKECLIPTV